LSYYFLLLLLCTMNETDILNNFRTRTLSAFVGSRYDPCEPYDIERKGIFDLDIYRYLFLYHIANCPDETDFELSPYNCVKREIEKEPCCFPFGRINSGPKTPNIRRNATMAQYHITLNDELLHGLFTRDEGLAKLLEQ